MCKRKDVVLLKSNPGWAKWTGKKHFAREVDLCLSLITINETCSSDRDSFRPLSSQTQLPLFTCSTSTPFLNLTINNNIFSADLHKSRLAGVFDGMGHVYFATAGQRHEHWLELRYCTMCRSGDISILTKR